MNTEEIKKEIIKDNIEDEIKDEINKEELNNPNDIKYMKEAIRQAKKAWKLNEVPIGCVIVYHGSAK